MGHSVCQRRAFIAAGGVPLQASLDAGTHVNGTDDAVERDLVRVRAKLDDVLVTTDRSCG